LYKIRIEISIEKGGKMNQLSGLLSKKQNQTVEELKELLRIPSISSLSENKEDIQKAASWISDKLTKKEMITYAKG